MAVREIQIRVLEERGGGQQDVRVVRCISLDLLQRHREQVLSAKASQNRVLIRRHRRGIGVVNDHRLHRRVAQFEQRRAELRHVHQPRRAAERRELLQVSPLERLAIQPVRMGRRELKSAADLFPGPGQSRQQRNRVHRQPSALAALHAVVQADHGRAHGGILTRQAHDLFGGNPCQRRRSLRRVLLHLLAKLVETGRVTFDVIDIVQILSDQHVHHPQRQRRVAARVDEKMLVGELPRPVAMWIDDVKLRPIAARFHNKRPQVHIRTQNVRAPRQDQLRVAKLLGLGGEPVPERRRQRRAAGGRADRAVESRRAQPMEKAPVHA